MGWFTSAAILPIPRSGASDRVRARRRPLAARNARSVTTVAGDNRAEMPKVRDRKSVWIHGLAEVRGVMGNSYDLLRTVDSDSLVLHCTSPQLIPRGALEDERVVAVACPTPSPFSHDANLMRTLAIDRGLLAVCGLDFPDAVQPVRIEISPSRSVITVDGVTHKVTTNLAGSDEALGYLVSGAGVCYRPFYLYDDWLGNRIARGLAKGVGERVVGAAATAQLDADGRVWLRNGPVPRDLAEWIIAHPDSYVSMLIELTTALGELASGRWSQVGILTDPAFLAAFDVNCVVAPFVGFPLFSLTRRSLTDTPVGEAGRSLEARVSQVSRLISVADRQRGTLSPGVLAAVADHLHSIRRVADPTVELAAAAVLLSDARRIVIDGLRRTYPMFKQHTRHRALT